MQMVKLPGSRLAEASASLQIMLTNRFCKFQKTKPLNFNMQAARGQAV
jgi:hypothetical protein